MCSARDWCLKVLWILSTPDHNIPQNSLVVKFMNNCVVMTQYQELNPAMLLLWQCYLDDRLTVPTQAVKQTLQP